MEFAFGIVPPDGIIAFGGLVVAGPDLRSHGILAQRNLVCLDDIREVDASEIEDNKDTNAEITEGLATAIRQFLIVSAETSLNGKITCSALIHPSVRIKEHNVIVQKIGTHLNDILQNMEDEVLQSSFRECWEDLQKTKPDILPFGRIFDEIRDLLFHSKINIITLNSVSDASQSIKVVGFFRQEKPVS